MDERWRTYVDFRLTSARWLFLLKDTEDGCGTRSSVNAAFWPHWSVFGHRRRSFEVVVLEVTDGWPRCSRSRTEGSCGVMALHSARPSDMKWIWGQHLARLGRRLLLVLWKIGGCLVGRSSGIAQGTPKTHLSVVECYLMQTQPLSYRIITVNPLYGHFKGVWQILPSNVVDARLVNVGSQSG